MEIRQTDQFIEFFGDFRVLSSAPLNGGLKEAKRIVNHTTTAGHEGPVEDYFRDRLSLSSGEIEDVVGFLTAVDVKTAFTKEARTDTGTVKVALTAGVNDSPGRSSHNTINVMLFADVDITSTAMANLFIVITEAKVSALKELDILENGAAITGTPTDAIAVATPNNTGVGSTDYAGTGTEIGKTTYELVKQGVGEALRENNGYRPDRNVLDRLKERGISREEIISSGFELLVGDTEREEIREEFLELLERYSEDPNIHFLVASSFHLEEERDRFRLEGDPGHLVADELLGINIAEYIGGKKALFNFFRYDTKKPGVLGELPPFIDDAVGGLIAGIMTKLF
ncbi:adenosylcobinamide amidohydrolase [Candidatus Bipolaricaulota bacterium]|nr:adenosylcobinamide amidohydrolase [Candidatus Bipolaricaulota bacterium]